MPTLIAGRRFNGIGILSVFRGGKTSLFQERNEASRACFSAADTPKDEE